LDLEPSVIPTLTRTMAVDEFRMHVFHNTSCVIYIVSPHVVCNFQFVMK